MGSKKPYVVNLVVFDAEEVLYLAEMKTGSHRQQTEIEQVVSPVVNLMELAELFRKLATEQEGIYYMGRVRTLSREAREQIEETLRSENLDDSAPF